MISPPTPIPPKYPPEIPLLVHSSPPPRLRLPCTVATPTLPPVDSYSNNQKLPTTVPFVLQLQSDLHLVNLSLSSDYFLFCTNCLSHDYCRTATCHVDIFPRRPQCITPPERLFTVVSSQGLSVAFHGVRVHIFRFPFCHYARSTCQRRAPLLKARAINAYVRTCVRRTYEGTYFVRTL